MFLTIDNIHKTFGNNHVLKGISTQLNRGDVMSIIGPSGSGKSTFLSKLMPNLFAEIAIYKIFKKS